MRFLLQKVGALLRGLIDRFKIDRFKIDRFEIDRFEKVDDSHGELPGERSLYSFPTPRQKGGNVMRKIALVNQKGGCGKTTTAINLAHLLAGEGKTVLLIDLDPQGHAGIGLGAEIYHAEKTIYEVLLGKIPISEAIQNLKENLDVVLSDVVLSAFEQVMTGASEREYKLSQSLVEVENKYDYLIIDSPPSVGLLTFNGLVAAEEVIIPVDSSYFSLHGLGKLLDTIRIIEERIRHALSVKILATNVDLRTNFCRSLIEDLKARFPESCYQTMINTCTRLREAAREGKAIGEFDKHSAGFRDYQSLAREILDEEPEMVARGFTLESFLAAEGRLELPEQREILFKLEAPEGSVVQIAGDFNKWVPESLDFIESQGRPMWHKTISLRPGSYEYKYLVDGSWIADPANESTVEDAYGGVNSLISL